MAKDHYQILGLVPTATHEEIEAAYQALLEQYNPDHYLDPQEKADMIRQSLEIKTAYRKVMEQRRQSFDFAGQVPDDRTWAMQRGAPFRAPPPQPGEEVVIFRPEPKGEAGLLKRPVSWGDWWASLVAALLGSLPLLLALAGLSLVLTWAVRRGVTSAADWLLLVGALAVAALLGALGFFPAYRMWLLLTRLRPARQPFVRTKSR